MYNIKSSANNLYYMHIHMHAYIRIDRYIRNIFIKDGTVVYFHVSLSAFKSRHCACRFGVRNGISVNNPVAMIYDMR